MIFFHSGKYDLASAQQSLIHRGLRVSRLVDSLEVQWEMGPILRVGLSNEKWVKQEAAEISERNPRVPALATCDARFEISFEDLDQVLDETNTLIEVQATLQNDTKGYAFNTWNGELMCPDD